MPEAVHDWQCHIDILAVRGPDHSANEGGVQQRDVRRGDVRDVGLGGDRPEAGRQALKRPAALGRVLDDPHARRERGQLLVRRSHDYDESSCSAADDARDAVEQSGAMPLEIRLGPAHASGAAPGQHDTGHLTHAIECTYLSEPALGASGARRPRVSGRSA
jgi:hypothetical protein